MGFKFEELMAANHKNDDIVEDCCLFDLHLLKKHEMGLGTFRILINKILLLSLTENFIQSQIK